MATAQVGKEITRYSFDGDGRLVSILHPSGILDERTYDAAGRLTEITGTAPHAKLFYSRAYAYDPVGNPTRLEALDPREQASPSNWWKKAWDRDEALSKWTESYSYDSRDRLTQACMNSHCSHYYAYAYDPVGNRTSLTTRQETTLYAYDLADELLSSSEARHDHHQDVTHYAYDQNGNQTRAGSALYAYNLENKLSRVRDEHGHDLVSYTYGGEGLMATRSSHSEVTSYAWDTSSDLPQLAQETVSKGQGRSASKSTSSYTYGSGPIGIVQGKDSLTFHTDALGSVVELSDAKGKLVQSYRYSPYGESYGPGNSGEASDAEQNPIRFTGQYLDSESDLYNMRAREYAPETGTFLQVDPLETDSGAPAVGAYVYVGDQPTVMTDPSGERGAMMTTGVARHSTCSATSSAKPGPNECGPGGWIGKLVPDKIPGFVDFHESCNWHDTCYGDWSKHKRGYCDGHFYNLMKDSCFGVYDCPICDSLGSCGIALPGCDARYKTCQGIAHIYYKAVRSRLGRKVFDKNQFAACPWKRSNPSKCWKNIHKRDS